MTTLSHGVAAPPEPRIEEKFWLGEYQRPGFGTVRVFDTLDPEVLRAWAEPVARADWLAGAHDITPHTPSMLLEWAWQLYVQSFTELNKNTVQRHMMFRHEFNELMTDTRQLKFLAFNTDGDLIGMSVYTNQLDAVHLISPQYFETHHPQEYAAGQVWWVSFVAVSQDARGSITFNELIKAMFAQHGPEAITGIDYAKVNVERGLASAACSYLKRICKPLGHDAEYEQVDYQGYHLYTYPEKAEAPA